MPTITSSGAGSGLNVASLVSQLVAAERATYDARYTKADVKLTTEVSALAQLKGAMSSFQSALSNLKKAEDFSLRKVSVGDQELLTATATSAAAAGSYQVEVVQIAKALQLGSAAFATGPDTVVGTGTLSFELGTKSFNITLGDSTNTLAHLRDAINSATDNPGLRATIIRDVDGAHLVLSSAKTGEASTVKITANGGNGGLAQFAYDPPGNNGSYTVLSPAQDAIVRVSGYEIHDSDNSISDAIDGVTLNLKAEKPGTEVSLDVATDNTGIRDKVNAFVNAYNVLANQIAKLRAYDPATKAAGPMLGDAMLRNVESQLRRMVSEPVAGVSGDYTTLASLGIRSSATGALTLDAAKLDAALTTDPAAVARVFSAEQGVAVKIGSFLEKKLATDGELAVRDAGAATRRKDLTRQREALDARMAVIEARYTKQFNALDSLLTKLQSTSTYLSQQLASLPGSSG